MTREQTKTATIAELIQWIRDCGWKHTDNPKYVVKCGQTETFYDALWIETYKLYEAEQCEN